MLTTQSEKSAALWIHTARSLECWLWSQNTWHKLLSCSHLNLLVWKTEDSQFLPHRLSWGLNEKMPVKWSAVPATGGSFGKLWATTHYHYSCCCSWKLGAKQWLYKEHFQCCGTEVPLMGPQSTKRTMLPLSHMNGGKVKGCSLLQNCLAFSNKANLTRKHTRICS